MVRRTYMILLPIRDKSKSRDQSLVEVYKISST